MRSGEAVSPAATSIVGSTIRLDDKPYEVVGITPPGFFFPDTDARLWVPAPCGMQGFDARGSVLLHAVGRMRAGVSAAQAQADLDLVNARLAKAYPDTNKNVTAGVFPLRHILIGKYERALWTLVWSIALVLLIACANVVHLQLARGVDRETELAVRAAAGAGRHRLLRQLLTESFLLVTVSAVLGLFVAWIGVRLIHAFALTDIPRMEVRADRRASPGIHAGDLVRDGGDLRALAGMEGVRREGQRDAQAGRDRHDGRLAEPGARPARDHGDCSGRHAARRVRAGREELRPAQSRGLGLQPRQPAAHRRQSCQGNAAGSRLPAGVHRAGSCSSQERAWQSSGLP